MTLASKTWIEQCQAARDIEDEFGVPKALAYLKGWGVRAAASRVAQSLLLFGQ
jgi:hypothetical protein